MEEARVPERTQTKKDIRSMDYEQLQQEVALLGEKPFRAKQLYQWMHEKLAGSFDEMTNLPKNFREKLKEQYDYTVLTLEDRLISGIDGTEKYLFGLEDGNVIESVLMRYHHGNSVCISSQVGCRMGCRFCASTLLGLERSLTPAEMLNEVYMAGKDSGQKISSIVLMGIGEPLDNFDNVMDFLEILSSPQGLN